MCWHVYVERERDVDLYFGEGLQRGCQEEKEGMREKEETKKMLLVHVCFLGFLSSVQSRSLVLVRSEVELVESLLDSCLPCLVEC